MDPEESEYSADENRGAWNSIKGIMYLLLGIGGERSVNGAWTVYSLARAFVGARFKNAFTSEPESEYVINNLKPGQVCIDIGANTGDYTHLFSTLVGPAGRVHSIEPNPSVFGILSKRVKLFRLKNVRCHQMGLGEHVGVGELLGGSGRPGDRALAHLKGLDNDGNTAGQSITLTTLDDFARDQNTGRIDFIKCDVEGFELMVFKGGQNVLNNDRPTILCEVEERWMRYGHAASDVFLLFQSLGYGSFVWERGELSPIEGVHPEINNYIFVPQERA